MQSPDSMNGQVEVCPECGSSNIVPKLYIEPKTNSSAIIIGLLIAILIAIILFSTKPWEYKNESEKRHDKIMNLIQKYNDENR